MQGKKETSHYREFFFSFVRRQWVGGGAAVRSGGGGVRRIGGQTSDFVGRNWALETLDA